MKRKILPTLYLKDLLLGLFLLVLLSQFSLLSAQTLVLKGRIYDEQNNPIIGATVLLKGENNGTTTDAQGNFSLQTEKEEGELVFSFLGYKSVEKNFNLNTTNFEILLQEDNEVLKEVVVGFEKVNVYSRRRQEDLQKIPESVTAFSSQQIEQSGIENTTDFIALTPNATFINSQNVGNVALTIRGISQVRNGDAPVAFVVDGVTLPSPNSINQELYDIELIEVTKGPQGALYGRNAIGGAINILTKKPTNEYEHFVKTSYGNGNNLKLQAGSSGKVVKDKLLYRVSGFFQNRNGLIENETLQEKVDFMQQFGLRGQILAAPTEKLSLDLSLSYNRTEAGAIYYAPLVQDGQSRNFEVSPQSDFLGRGDRNLLDAYLKVNYDLKEMNLEWISAYSGVEEIFRGDLDFTAASLLRQEQELTNRGIIEELRLTSESNQKLRWIIGAFLMYNKRDLITTGTVDLASDLAPLFGFEPSVGFAPFLQRNEANQNTTLAGFGQINYDLVKNLEFSIALRYDYDLRQQTDILNQNTREANFSQFQPKFSLAYRPKEQVTLFAAYAQGFRSGGFNAPGIAAFPALFEKELTHNFEAGIKTSWAKNRLIWNSSFFRIDFRNQQAFIVDINTVSQGIINIDQTIAQGFESELRWKLLPNFEVGTAFGLTDAKITKYTENSSWEGNFSPLTARTTFNLALQYQQKIGEKSLLVPRLDLERRGKLYWHLDNSDFQEPILLLNARLNWIQPKWTLSFFGNNLLNTAYNTEFFAKEFSGGGADIRWQAQPLSIGLSLKVNF
ncbi:TonB-dependent receptor [Hugenholtzia roseola]|uniref:TonB-dependent receptor n=1 Tax=Hugenholtzia roseola TaxID=1002 RepID=UPI00041A0C29|nr:TonB-dependent receptor [Hugenholtzia roseola]